jgi:tetratricopeptide (TPR) repeat protein
MLSRTLAVIASLTLTAPIVAAPRAAAQEDVPADADARALFDEGRAAYTAGRFEDAVRAFRRAYVLSPRYQLLYNIGQAELRGGHDDRALQAFEGYLRQAPPDASDRSEVQERVTVLRSMGVTPSTLPADQPTPDTEPASDAPTTTTTETRTTSADLPDASSSSSSSGADPAPWILVGIGGAAVVAGAILMGVGVSEAQRVTDAPSGSRWVDLAGAADSANTLWGVGIAAAAVGLAAVGAGIVWALGSGSRAESEPESASARVRVGVGLGSVSIEGEL